MSALGPLGFLFLLLLLSGFFSGSETALLSLPRSRYARTDDDAGKRIRTLLEHPQKLLATILFGNLLVNIAATSTATAVFLSLIGSRGLGVAIFVMGFALLLFGEILPKAFALRRNEWVSIRIAAPIQIVSRLFAPVVYPLQAITVRILRSMGIDTGRRPLRRGELETAVDLGTIGPVEKELLSNVVAFGDTRVREVMTPRVRVEAVEASTSIESLETVFRGTGFSRLPVYQDRFENVVGVVYAKDLIESAGGHAVEDVTKVMRPPFFVPESMKIRTLLDQMRKARVHYAVAVDEHGSLEGLVTLEDILEEIVGEVEDERKEMEHRLVRLREGAVSVVGHMPLDRLNEVLGARLESARAETVAGYLLELIGRIPSTGEAFRFHGLKFLVLQSKPNLIERVYVEKMSQEDSEQ